MVFNDDYYISLNNILQGYNRLGDILSQCGTNLEGRSFQY